MALFRIYNSPAPTTAARAAVTTGTAIKTLLQVKMGSTNVGKVKAWGISFDGSVAATPGKVELIETNVAATVTAHVAAGINKVDAAALLCGDPTTSLFAVGTTSTGYTSTSEGSTTTTRTFDCQYVSSTNQYAWTFREGEEPIVNLAMFLRIRVHFGTAQNAICWIDIES